MKSNSNLHTIKTKLIAQNRVDTHSEKDLEGWFEKYYATLDKYNIRKSRNIWNRTVNRLLNRKLGRDLDRDFGWVWRRDVVEFPGQKWSISHSFA